MNNVKNELIMENIAFRNVGYVCNGCGEKLR